MKMIPVQPAAPVANDHIERPISACRTTQPREERRTTRETLLVISPHLDDAVFSCGALMAANPGTVVCTVFAGTPLEARRCEWDVAAGFLDSTDAMRTRAREDIRALAKCGAQGNRLTFLDGQYAQLPQVDTIAAALSGELARFPGARLVVPLGLRHPDHRLVADAWVSLFRARTIKSCIVYEEAIHRTARGQTEQRLAELARSGFLATPLDDSWYPERVSARSQGVKRRSVLCYTSQLQAFAGVPTDLGKPERYWLVERGISADTSRQPGVASSR